MKCAYCEYSVPVKNSPCFNCTYSGNDSRRTDKCDEALQFMWMYNKIRANQNKGQATTYNIKKVIMTLERDRSIAQEINLSDHCKGYIAGLNRAINIVKAEVNNEIN